jgi:SOS-response transcriptional repressor LexA
MTAEELTERQSKVLKFIERSVLASGYPPTLREIGHAFGIRSTNGVNDHLRALMRKGYLAKEEGKSRTLKLLQPKAKSSSQRRQAKNIPVIETLGDLEDTATAGGLYAIRNVDTSRFQIVSKDKNGELSILATFHFAL